MKATNPDQCDATRKTSINKIDLLFPPNKESITRETANDIVNIVKGT
jgi:hypothetical protein